jgi:hypothetical protein
MQQNYGRKGKEVILHIIGKFAHSGNLAEMGKNFTPREVIL